MDTDIYALEVIEVITQDGDCAYLSVSATAFILIDLDGELISSTPISPGKHSKEIH